MEAIIIDIIIKIIKVIKNYAYLKTCIIFLLFYILLLKIKYFMILNVYKNIEGEGYGI